MELSLLETALSTLITRDAPATAVGLVTASLVAGAAMGAAPLWLGALRRQPLPAAAGFLGSTLAALLLGLHAATHGAPWALAGIGAAFLISAAASVAVEARRPAVLPAFDLDALGLTEPAGALPDGPDPAEVPAPPLLVKASPAEPVAAPAVPDPAPAEATVAADPTPEPVMAAEADVPVDAPSEAAPEEASAAPSSDASGPGERAPAAEPEPEPSVLPVPEPEAPRMPDMDLSSLFSAPAEPAPSAAEPVPDADVDFSSFFTTAPAETAPAPVTPAPEAEDVDLSALFAPAPAEPAGPSAPAPAPETEAASAPALRDCTALVDGIVHFDAKPAGARATINGERAGRLPVRVSANSGDVFEYVFSHPKHGRVEGKLTVP